MPETIAGHLYDYPKYYDLVFGSDWKAEFDFLQACFARHAQGTVRRVYEPACGTGRLLVKLAQAGYETAGHDLNPRAVEYCQNRLDRLGLSARVRVADMCDFREPKRYDAAFNMINSFRHLPTEAAAAAHLRCVAAVLRRGGLYLLGLHLTPRGRQECTEERWSARRGQLMVNSRLWTISVDRRRRVERVGMTFDVYTLTRHFRLEDELAFRVYTHEQFRELLAAVPEFEPIAAYDFHYDLKKPVDVGPTTEDVVWVLRKS